MIEIKGKTVIITGGSKGIGYGVAECLIDEGMNVVITSRTESEVKEAAANLNSRGKGKAIGIVSDVTDLASEKSAVAQAIATFGKLDVVLANAGVGHFAPVDEMDPAQWKRVIDINLTGAFNTLKASVEALKESQGYYITLASLAGTNFFERGAAYNASKFGLVGFTQAAMLDLRKYGIKTSTIMPGSVATYFNDHVPNDQDAWKIQPEDIGKLVVDLLTMHPRTLPSKIEVRPTIPPSVQRTM